MKNIDMLDVCYFAPLILYDHGVI